VSGPAQVAIDGISMGSAITGAGVWTGVLTLFGIIWKSRVPMRKLNLDADETLRKDLMEQINKKDAEHGERVKDLETKIEGMRKSYEGKLEAMRAGYEAKLEAERATHAAELAIVRHRMNNLDQCLTMMLALIESNPDKAGSVVQKVTEMRVRQEQMEADEKARIREAQITSSAAAAAFAETKEE